MAEEYPFGHFVTVDSRAIRAPWNADSLADAQQLLQHLLPLLPVLDYQVIAIPSRGWVQYTGHLLTPTPLVGGDPILALRLRSHDAVRALRIGIQAANNVAARQVAPFVDFGVDLGIGATEYFCPANLNQLLFGNRGAAGQITHAPFLKQQGLTGNGVNIVVIDTGFDRTLVRNFGGGWGQNGIKPGATTRGHGLMIVRNIQDAAPDAIFWDLPLIPLLIDNVNAFIATAVAALRRVVAAITSAPQSGPWVLVNAWAIFDRASEYPLGEYTQNTQIGGHPFNNLVGWAVANGIDFVFGAGNCGQFCPDRRCGVTDYGPGSSIWGANSHRDVLTLGAVRTDVRWLGNSSQGPGQPLLGVSKPDLCAPSNFRDDANTFTGNTDEPWVGNTGSPYIANTGTSAACGLSAGIVAALRGMWGPHTVAAGSTTAGALVTRLNNSASCPPAGWDPQLGNGIIDAEAAYENLNLSFPATSGPYP
jgi:hypothetical protein